MVEKSEDKDPFYDDDDLLTNKPSGKSNIQILIYAFIFLLIIWFVFAPALIVWYSLGNEILIAIFLLYAVLITLFISIYSTEKIREFYSYFYKKNKMIIVLLVLFIYYILGRFFLDIAEIFQLTAFLSLGFLFYLMIKKA